MVCTLEIASLADDPKYEALSYVWGEEDTCGHQVSLDSAIVGVRRNLWDTLHALRRNRTVERVIWVDSLCINQYDLKERGHQVALMGMVYSKTECCIAWINTESRFSQN